MRIILTAIILIIPFIMFSCKEDEGNLIEGRVTTYPEENPLENASTKLEVNKIEQGSYTNSFTLLGQTSTDVNGEFSFTFDAIRAHEYKLTVSHELYRDKVIEFEPTDFAATYNKNIVLVKDATLEIHIQNYFQPTNHSDKIKIRVSDIPTECTDCAIEQFQTLTGIIDTTLVYQVAGDDDVHIEYTITKDGSEYHQVWQRMEPNQVNTRTIRF